MPCPTIDTIYKPIYLIFLQNIHFINSHHWLSNPDLGVFMCRLYSEHTLKACHVTGVIPTLLLILTVMLQLNMQSLYK